MLAGVDRDPGTHPSLLGTRLQFDREGTNLVVVDRDAVSVVPLGGGALRIDAPGVSAAACFSDQLWVVGEDDALVRYALVGGTARPVGERVPLPYASAPALVAVPHGPPGAVWTSRPPLGLLDDLGELVQHEHAAADAVIPITTRRAIVVNGPQLTMPAGNTIELAPRARVLGGVALSDATAAALVVEHDGHRKLVVISLARCAVVARFEIAGELRIAARRALAIVQCEPSRFEALDLRAGLRLGGFAIEHPAADFAVDPDACQLAIRHGDAIELVPIAETVTARGARRGRSADVPRPAADGDGAAVAGEPAPESVPIVIESPELVEPAPPPVAARSLAEVLAAHRANGRWPLALEPRAATRIDREAALAHLDRELRGVSLWTLRAIADAWDTRRLGYGNEGKHPYELEVAAILGAGRGFATEYVAAADERLAEHDRAVAADPGWRGADTPLGALSAELGLSARAADVLVAIAAPALWGEIARLYGILANDPGRALVDEVLVERVLAHRHDRHAFARELDPRAPLVRFGVVRVDPRRRRPFAELEVDPVILDRLRAIPPGLGAAVAIRAATCSLEDLAAPAAVLVEAIEAFARAPHGPTRIAVRGRSGAGRRTLLAALAAEAGRQLAVIDAQLLPPAADGFTAALAAALRRVHLAGAVPCLAGLERVVIDERRGAELAAEIVRAHPGPVMVIAPPDAPVPFAPGHLAITLPALPETDRLEVWSRALHGAGLAVADLDGLVARYRIAPGVIHRAVEQVRAERADATRPPGPVTTGAALEAFIRQTRDAALGQHARRVERLAAWSDVVLPPDITDSLRELIGRVRHRRTVFEDWGMGRTMSTSRGLTALFQGQPGTGKTLVAGVIARELKLDLYQVDLSRVMSKWLGETERNLAAIFDAAEDGHVVLLFDEADSLFAKRTEVRSSNDRYANLEVNYLLQRLDAFEGIAILTTNFAGSIDPALKRRMSFRLSFPFPDEETRELLWRAHLPATLPVAGELQLGALAHKYQLSGGYIRNACLRAAFLAAQEETSLHQHHLERAVALEFAELGKLSPSGAID